MVTYVYGLSTKHTESVTEACDFICEFGAAKDTFGVLWESTSEDYPTLMQDTLQMMNLRGYIWTTTKLVSASKHIITFRKKTATELESGTINP